MATTDLTAARLRELLYYNPETGEFSRLTNGYGKPIAPQATGVKMDNGYIYVHVEGTLMRAHRLAWLYVTGSWPTACIDHINGVKSDNRFANLRDISHRKNAENRRLPKATSSSGFIGVSRDKKRWRANITVNGVQRHIGTFDTAEQAAQAYIAEKRKNHSGCTI